MRKVCFDALWVLALLASLTSCNASSKTEWVLPIGLNQSKVDIYEKLGFPTEIVDAKKMASMGVGDDWKKANPSRSLEYFYEKGLVVKFLGDSAIRVTVQTYHGYPGWKLYSGPIFGDLLPSDNRTALLKKLGKPTRMTTDALPNGLNLDSGVTMPSESQYYWDKGSFVIEVSVLNQAQRADSSLVIPRDRLSFISLYDKKDTPK